MQTNNQQLKEQIIVSNDNLLIRNDTFLFKTNNKEKIELSSILRLLQAINKTILKSNSNILLSFEGQEFYNENIQYFSSYFIKNNHNVFKYHNNFSISLILDEYAYKKASYDFLIKFKNIKNDNYITIQIFDKNFEILTSENLQKIYDYYQLNKWQNKEIVIKDPKLVNEFELIDELASKEQILKAFVNVKQRYKTLSYFASDNKFSQSIGTELLNNYQNKYITNNKNISLLNLKWLTFFAASSWYRENKIQNIFHFDINSNLNVCLRLNDKFKWLNSHELVLIYLDFFLEEIKRNGIDISNSYVVVPQNTTYQILELLKQYKVKYYFYDLKNINKQLKNESCLFAYIDNKFIANPRYSTEFNNYYFFICLIWMLNSYTNRNNLLSFKYNQLAERVGKIKISKKSYKYSFDKLENLIKYFSLNYKRWFTAFNAYRVWNDHKYMLFKLINNKKHQMIFYWDDVKGKLVIEYQMCCNFENISNTVWRDKLKLQILLFVLIKKAQKHKIEKEE
ncbi:MAG5620 family putative phospho-sugar mutase [Mycoplasmopsis fermentans]|uniref:MAG5620 family putative phospho-sugar mutase n=1 Tax=Mycoplasmopsis fermentans TaxID=2115 RepID=UPI000F016550|nr:hypothetical protein [Mycoplasmopsis fermentans]RMX35831.1 hypothetical protein MFI2_0295 [Mycoplasmopsis fermentans MF-I2]RMX35893.1 hypothetical protein MFI1_0295 [Mycoplasmopsis fermentans MF-I1]